MKQILETLLLLETLASQKDSAITGGHGVDELRKKIPVQVLQHCDRLRVRGKKGVVYVRNGVCSQCHMQVAVGLLASLRRVDNLYRCANCGSYLCLAAEPAPLELPPRSAHPGRRGRPPKAQAHVA